MAPSNLIKFFAGLVLFVATAAAALAQTAGVPIVSRPSNAAVSPNLSDLPTAHRSHGGNPRVVPPPKRLAPPKAGPGGPPDDKTVTRPS